MAMITTITRLPPLPRPKREDAVDAVSPTGLAPIDDTMPTLVALPADHLLLLSRKLAAQSRAEQRAMLGSAGDGLVLD